MDERYNGAYSDRDGGRRAVDGDRGVCHSRQRSVQKYLQSDVVIVRLTASSGADFSDISDLANDASNGPPDLSDYGSNRTSDFSKGNPNITVDSFNGATDNTSDIAFNDAANRTSDTAANHTGRIYVG